MYPWYAHIVSWHLTWCLLKHVLTAKKPRRIFLPQQWWDIWYHYLGRKTNHGFGILSTPGSLVESTDQLRYNARGLIVLHQGLKDLVIHLKILGQVRNGFWDNLFCLATRTNTIMSPSTIIDTLHVQMQLGHCTWEQDLKNIFPEILRNRVQPWPGQNGGEPLYKSLKAQAAVFERMQTFSS